MASELKVAIASGALAFAGAIVGNYVASYLEEQRSDRQFVQQYRVHILDKRLAIMERCSTVRSEFPRAKVLSDYEKSLRTGVQTPSALLIQVQKDLVGIVADYSTCVYLAAQLFGPKTEMAAQRIDTSQVYDPNDDKVAALFFAMDGELSDFAPPQKPRK